MRRGESEGDSRAVTSAGNRSQNSKRLSEDRAPTGAPTRTRGLPGHGQRTKTNARHRRAQAHEHRRQAQARRPRSRGLAGHASKTKRAKRESKAGSRRRVKKHITYGVAPHQDGALNKTIVTITDTKASRMPAESAGCGRLQGRRDKDVTLDATGFCLLLIYRLRRSPF